MRVLLAFLQIIAIASCFRVFLESGSVQGELVRAPILERNAFQVLRANQNVWGRRVVLYQPVSDKYGCSVPSVFANLRDDEKQRLAVLLLDGGGCSPEQKSVMWQRAGALCIVLATQFQWVADLAAVMSDSTNLDNVTIPLFFVKYDSNWRTPPTVDWGMKLMEEMAAGRNVSVQLDFPDREEITWDLRSGNAKLSAFLNYCVMTLSVILIALLSIKVTLMWEVTKGALTVPLAILVLDMFSCFFMLLSSVFGPYFSSGYFCSEAALFFQTFYLPWCLSANTLLSFFWLEISFHNSHVTATIHRLFIPCVVNCVLLFMLEISRDVILAVNANPYISYYLSVVGYAILGLAAFVLLFVAVARMLFRMMNSGSKLASLAPRLAFFMCTDIVAGLIMIGGLVVYAAFEFHRYMTTMFFNIFLLQGGALLMITSHNFLFQMHTQRRMVELGVVVAQFDATAKQPTPPRKTSEFEAQDI